MTLIERLRNPMWVHGTDLPEPILEKDQTIGDMAEAANVIDAHENEVDRAPEPVKRLGSFLADILNEDDWKTAESMLLAISSLTNGERNSG